MASTASPDGDRHELRELAEAHGFDRAPEDRKDTFHRDDVSVEVHYDDGVTASIVRRFRAGQQNGPPVSGRITMNAARNWLTTKAAGADETRGGPRSLGAS